MRERGECSKCVRERKKKRERVRERGSEKIESDVIHL